MELSSKKKFKSCSLDVLISNPDSVQLRRVSPPLPFSIQRRFYFLMTTVASGFVSFSLALNLERQIDQDSSNLLLTLPVFSNHLSNSIDFQAKSRRLCPNIRTRSACLPVVSASLTQIEVDTTTTTTSLCSSIVSSKPISEALLNISLADLDPGTAKLAIRILGPALSAFGFLFILRIVISYSKRADATADLSGAIEVCHSYLSFELLVLPKEHSFRVTCFTSLDIFMLQAGNKETLRSAANEL